MSIFMSGSPFVKSAAQKKVQRVAQRVSKAQRERTKNGPVTVTVFVPSRPVAPTV
jgi:hypothetical protein